MAEEINIQHLARLARLSLDADAIEHARGDLKNIIAMINTMQAVETEGIEPMAHPWDAAQRLRADVVSEEVDPEKFQAGAPETAQGYYLVPRVVE